MLVSGPFPPYIVARSEPRNLEREDKAGMSGFDERKQKEEGRYKHDQELMFKARNRGNKLFGLWVAEKLGLDGEAAQSYAKDVVMADFDAPGDDDVFDKVRPDLAAKSITIEDDILTKHLEKCRAEALQQIKAE